MSIKSEVLAIAQEHGYEGSAQTITGAINALTDTLAGSDVQGGRTVASAIHALGPYIGGGGGGDGITIGAGFFVMAKQAYSTITNNGIEAMVDGKSVVSIHPTTTPGSMPTVPSGLDYMVVLDVDTEVTSVTLSKYDEQSEVIDSQSIEYTAEADEFGFGIRVNFSVPSISMDGAYGEYDQPLYGVTIQA